MCLKGNDGGGWGEACLDYVQLRYFKRNKGNLDCVSRGPLAHYMGTSFIGAGKV
jgi:hypothetical protein